MYTRINPFPFGEWGLCKKLRKTIWSNSERLRTRTRVHGWQVPVDLCTV